MDTEGGILAVTAAPNIVDAIYSAALDEKGLSVLAKLLAEYANAYTASLSLHVCDMRAFLTLRDYLVAETEIDFSDQFLTEDVWALASGRLEAIDRTGLREGVAAKDIYSRLFLAHSDSGHLGLSALITTEHGVISISAKRPIGSTPFSTSDASRLQSLIPHLRRMHTTRHRVQLLETQADLARNALDCFAYPTLVMLFDRQVILCNAAARAFLALHGSLFEQDGKLCARQPSDTRKLLAAIAKVQAHQDGKSPQTAQIFPLGSGSPEDLRIILSTKPGAKCVLVILDDPAAPRISGTNLAELYGLTAAETALADALLRGETIETFANTRNVRMTTVRSQLSSLMRKTETERQSQLIAVFSRLPALRHDLVQ